MNYQNIRNVFHIMFADSRDYMKERKSSVRFVSVVILLLLVSVFLTEIESNYMNTVDEQYAPVTLNEVESGCLLYKTDEKGKYIPSPALETDVSFKVTGMILRADVKQTFHNASDSRVEGIYVFPLPENSAVDYMQMKIGDRVVIGKIKERKAARKIYEKAKREGKKASLVEQERPNIFTNSVANIAPGEDIEITIKYQQTLKYDSGKFSFRFPMVVPPRFIPGNSKEISSFSGSGWAADTDQVPDASRITPPTIHPADSRGNPVSIKVELDAGFKLKNLESPYHSIVKEKEKDGLYTVMLATGETPANRDFVLEWEPLTGSIPGAALFTQQTGEDDYLLLMVLPPDAEDDKSERIPRETIFIIDTSGSMGGESIRQARQALLDAVDRLHPDDLFNIVEFNSYTRKVYPGSMQANSANVKNAKSVIRSLRAGGGTVMLPALKAALENQGSEGRVRQVIFMTDGSVGNESELFRYIKYNLGSSRLFTIGIGSAPNSFFMRKAAEFGNGTFTYIGSQHEIAEKMNGLFTKIETPYLSDINVNWSDDTVEMFPARIPDLYAGEPVLVSAKLSKITGGLRITGKRGKTPWKVNLELRGGSEKSGLDKLWARQKIEQLMNRYYEEGKNDAIRNLIVQVALKYHLVSKFTSLVAVDVEKTRPASEKVNSKNVPVHLPAGWDPNQAVPALPQTATPGTLYLILGGILILLALALKYGVFRS